MPLRPMPIDSHDVQMEMIVYTHVNACMPAKNDRRAVDTHACIPLQ